MELKMKSGVGLLWTMSYCLTQLKMDEGQTCIAHTGSGDFEIKKLNDGYKGGLNPDVVIIDEPDETVNVSFRVSKDRKLNNRSIDPLRLHLLG